MDTHISEHTTPPLKIGENMVSLLSLSIGRHFGKSLRLAHLSVWVCIASHFLWFVCLSCVAEDVGSCFAGP